MSAEKEGEDKFEREEKVVDSRAAEIKQQVDTTYLGLTGPVWCLLAGLCYGLLNLFAKLSFEAGMSVPHFILWRHVYQALFSSSFGTLVRGVDFNLFNYPREVNSVLIGRSLVNLVSKSM